MKKPTAKSSGQSSRAKKEKKPPMKPTGKPKPVKPLDGSYQIPLTPSQIDYTTGPDLNPDTRRPRVWDMFLQGWGIREIAIKERLHSSIIHTDIKSVQAEIKARRLEETELSEQEKMTAVARYEKIMRDAWEQWQKSIGDRVIRKVKTIKTQPILSKDGKSTYKRPTIKEVEEAITTGLGDPSYLTVIINAQKRIDQILGTDSAIKIDAKSMTTQINVDWDALYNLGRESREAEKLEEIVDALNSGGDLPMQTSHTSSQDHKLTIKNKIIKLVLDPIEVKIAEAEEPLTKIPGHIIGDEIEPDKPAVSLTNPGDVYPNPIYADLISAPLNGNGSHNHSNDPH